MAAKTPIELRISANLFRVMAQEGDDARLKIALLLVADEFDQEAAKLEAEDQRPEDAASKGEPE